MRRSTLKKLLDLDRRWIFLTVLICAIGARFVDFELPVYPKAGVRAMYDKIEEVAAKNGTIIVSMDYDPSSKPELEPLSRALLRHAFSRKVKVIAMTHNPNGQRLAQTVLEETASEFDVKYGDDYVLLGYKAGSGTLVINMGQDFRDAFSKDHAGKDLASFAVTRELTSIAQIDYVISVSASAYWESWMIYGHDRYGFPYGVGVTGVIAPDIFPFLQPGQVTGLVGGLAGAAEYETLIKKPGMAVTGMKPQSAIHMLLVLFVLFGNFVFFYDLVLKRRQEKGHREERRT